MKPVVTLILLCVLCGPAAAQTSECQSVPKASDRLACYDRLMPPTNRSKSSSAAAAKSSDAATSAPQAQSGDMLANENAHLDSRIKTICRGC
jgi:hypothetical protein